MGWIICVYGKYADVDAKLHSEFISVYLEGVSSKSLNNTATSNTSI